MGYLTFFVILESLIKTIPILFSQLFQFWRILNYVEGKEEIRWF